MATLRHVVYREGGYDPKRPDGNVLSQGLLDVADQDGGGPNFEALADVLASSPVLDAKTKSDAADALRGRRAAAPKPPDGGVTRG